MSKDGSKLLKKALRLRVEERAALARSILESMNPATDDLIETMRGSLARQDMPAQLELERDRDREFA